MERLIEVTSIGQIPYSRLMELYSQDLQENARRDYPARSFSEALFAAEQDFYTYMADVFFQTPGARFFALLSCEQWVSCLRLEPYADGYLICGITTDPGCKRKGYASSLLNSVLSQVDARVYSHVEKHNLVSIQLHEKCGFVRNQEWAEMLNGEILHNFCSFYYEK